jgi:hypothetical protein
MAELYFERFELVRKPPIPEPPLQRKHRRRAVIGGTLGGLAGVWIYLFYGTLLQVAQGRDGWLAVKLFALPVTPAAAMAPGFDAAAVALGALVPLVLGAALGALFGLVTHRLGPDVKLPVGAVYGVLVWALAAGLFWPFFPASWRIHAGLVMPDWAAMIQAMVFGIFAGLGATLAVLPKDFWRGLLDGRPLRR